MSNQITTETIGMYLEKKTTIKYGDIFIKIIDMETKKPFDISESGFPIIPSEKTFAFLMYRMNGDAYVRIRAQGTNTIPNALKIEKGKWCLFQHNGDGLPWIAISTQSKDAKDMEIKEGRWQNGLIILTFDYPISTFSPMSYEKPTLSFSPHVYRDREEKEKGEGGGFRDGKSNRMDFESLNIVRDGKISRSGEETKRSYKDHELCIVNGESVSAPTPSSSSIPLCDPDKTSILCLTIIDVSTWYGSPYVIKEEWKHFFYLVEQKEEEKQPEIVQTKYTHIKGTSGKVNGRNPFDNSKNEETQYIR